MSPKRKTEAVEKETPDIARDNIGQLKSLFPDAVTEGRVDFEKLKATLGEAVDDRPERYSFSWAGKRDAIRILQTPSRATLIPAPKESINFDTTQIKAPDGAQVMPKRQWRWSRPRVELASKTGELYFAKDKNGKWSVSSKQYLRDKDGQRETKFFSVIDDVYTQHGTNEMIDIFGDARVFSFPKPSILIAKLIQLACRSSEQEIVMDFFAGSATPGQGGGFHRP